MAMHARRPASAAGARNLPPLPPGMGLSRPAGTVRRPQSAGGSPVVLKAVRSSRAADQNSDEWGQQLRSPSASIRRRSSRRNPARPSTAPSIRRRRPPSASAKGPPLPAPPEPVPAPRPMSSPPKRRPGLPEVVKGVPKQPARPASSPPRQRVPPPTPAQLEAMEAAAAAAAEAARVLEAVLEEMIAQALLQAIEKPTAQATTPAEAVSGRAREGESTRARDSEAEAETEAHRTLHTVSCCRN